METAGRGTLVFQNQIDEARRDGLVDDIGCVEGPAVPDMREAKDDQPDDIAPPIIVGLGHRSGVGKDTFAIYLKAALEARCVYPTRIAFADYMKRSLADVLGPWGLQPPFHYEIHPEEKERRIAPLAMSPRDLWRAYAAFMRAIRPDVWVWHAMRYMRDIEDIIRHRRQRLAFIFTDVRFPNEIYAIRERGGVVLRVDNSRVPLLSDAATPDALLENWTGWYGVVRNETSFAALRGEAVTWAARLAGE